MEDTKKNSGSEGKNTDPTSMSNILNILSKLFGGLNEPVQQIPPPLLLIGSKLRPGMSARNLAGRSISRIDSEANIPMGNIFLDGENNQAKQVLIECEEIVNMIQTESKVEVVIDPGSIQITSSGSAGPIPVITQGSNITYVSGAGGIQ